MTSVGGKAEAGVSGNRVSRFCQFAYTNLSRTDGEYHRDSAPKSRGHRPAITPTPAQSYVIRAVIVVMNRVNSSELIEKS